MLGWMLKRGENAPLPGDVADTTDYDQPDTPAPVFAARALRSALFGTPAPPCNDPTNPTEKTSANEYMLPENTPSKPQGILLTPGTGTSRPKRVSFGRDVSKAKPYDTTAARKAGGAPKRSRLAQALENSRKKGQQEEAKTVEAKTPDGGSSDEWEEADEDNYCNHDITLDLNEPRSQSGQYWKDHFQKYQEEAKAELGKLLKYKQLAKSYAREKDAEAIALAEKLRDEQQKVIAMEKRIVANASQIAASGHNDTDEASQELLNKLTKQTAQAVQYRQRVQELEGQMETMRREKGEDGLDTVLQPRQTASPRTTKTLLETQRELRRARNQVKELGDLREQVSSLREQLRKARRQNSTEQTDGHGAEKLKSELLAAREETRRKDEELELLRREFEAFRKESQTHDEDTRTVLERAHGKIAELKKEVKSLKAASVDRTRPSSWHPQTQANGATQSTAERHDHGVSSGLAARKRDTAHTSSSEPAEPKMQQAGSRTLRDKFMDDASLEMELEEAEVNLRPASAIVKDRPDLQRPRWQPFVPRSPRNRAYLGEALSERAHNGARPSTVTKSKGIVAPDLPALAKSIAQSRRRHDPSHKDDEEVDLLQSRFARLGGPSDHHGNSTLLANTSKSVLPPERRAAAIARIEQRMAEKKKQAQKRSRNDKENARPGEAAMEW
ncbi:hypothetical protein S40288_00458 [Stachybotrys chartarum IBT 40288]|nr:hypothetical protein S40288_00458 [Stachybotrys chartarum IBT 40288]